MFSLFKNTIRLTNQLVKISSLQLKPTYRKATTIAGSRVILPKQNFIKEQTEYKQLPDDSMYIEKFYRELSQFQKEIQTNDNIKESNFSDFENDPNELIHQLELFVEGKIKPQYLIDVSTGGDNVEKKVEMERFDEFVRNVKITMILNGGHPMIFDILLQSKAHFDGFDKNKK